MRRISSAAALSNSIISARSRMGSSMHAIIIFTIMVVLFAFSMFLTPQHQHLKVAMLAPHGEQQCSAVQDTARSGLQGEQMSCRETCFVLYGVAILLHITASQLAVCCSMGSAAGISSPADMACILPSSAGSQEALHTATAAHAAAAKAAAAQAAEAAVGVLPTAAACHTEQGAEYSGDVIKWGESHLKVRG
jgi:hypothetical protein